jgi:hypothetical protein
MRLLKIYSLILIFSLSIGSCETMLSPEPDFHTTADDITDHPILAYGLLMSAYNRMPSNSLSYNDVATDDAVTNDQFNLYRRMATGEWSAIFNPVSNWDNSILAILYINKFLSFVDIV